MRIEKDKIAGCLVRYHRKMVYPTTMLLLLVALIISVTAPAMADTSGPRNAGVGSTNHDNINNYVWTNPDRIENDDSNYAYSQLGAATPTPYTYSDPLYAYNYGFSSFIPSNAIIEGIEVSIDRASHTGAPTTYGDGISDMMVKLLKNGTPVGDNKAAAGYWPEDTLTTQNYGGASDTWGESWTAADIHNFYFGVELRVRNDSVLYYDARVNFIQVTVTYSIPATTGVDIDIKPGSFPNSINTNSKGVIPVAILTTSTVDGDPVDFDALTVDPASVTFDPGGAAPVRWAAKDVDYDGDLDLLLHFKTQETGITAGDTEATLTGELLDETPIEGTDFVRVIG